MKKFILVMVLLYSVINLFEQNFIKALIAFLIYYFLNKLFLKNGNKLITENNKNKEEIIDSTNNNVEKEEDVNNSNNNASIKKEKISNEMSEEAKVYIEECNKIIYQFNNMLIKNSNENYPTELLNTISKYNKLLTEFIVIDTKKLTFIDFYKREYLCCPIITDHEKIAACFKEILDEMERRYNLLLYNASKNILEYNQKQSIIENILPYYFLVINDIYDIRMISKETYETLQQIILDGHKVGIITIMFSNVINKYLKLDLIKSNILECTEEECKNYIKEIVKANTEEPDDIKDLNTSTINLFSIERNNDKQNNDNYDDPMYNEVVEFAIETGKISASLIQRKFRFGFNRAANLINLLEERGIIGPQMGSKPREVLIKKDNK